MQTEKETIDSWLEYLPINERKLHRANSRISQLESGPGGIMEMKQTIADKEDKIYKLQEALRLIIGNSKLSQVSKEYLAKIAIAALEESK